ncbi:LysR family transcriptional regulator [Ottowia sp. VDI28]|uniref:LysR family transcriptional regulator n=1 Tax=Ottowia sp. VDI28 TaxID=3133968 RepID=UPI003C2E677D
MRINHRQLEAFRQFMESGTVTAAAERLYVTQPAMSKMLAALEYDLGLTLFVREKKRLTPTDDARLLYKEVRRLLSSVTAIERFAQDLRHIRAGDLRIVTAASLGHTLVADAVEVFVRENPEVNVALEISSSVGQDLLAQNVDIGFSVTQFHHSALHSAPLFHADAICVVPKDHPFSQRERIVPEDLEGVDFISFLRESRMRHIIDAVFEQSRVSRRLRMEVFPLPRRTRWFPADSAFPLSNRSMCATAIGPIWSAFRLCPRSSSLFHGCGLASGGTPA